MNEKSDLTLLCEYLTQLAGEGEEFSAWDLVCFFDMKQNRSPPGQLVGQAFRICARSGVIVKVRPVQSQGAGRNGSLIWLWRGV